MSWECRYRKRAHSWHRHSPRRFLWTQVCNYVVMHLMHPYTAAGRAEIRDNGDIQHHAGVLVIQDVAVQDIFADVTIVPGAGVYPVAVLDEQCIAEGVPHRAILA